MRVLDIDLDFFVEPPAHFRSSDNGRLDEEHYRCWEPDRAIDYLTTRCGLTGPLLGWVIEHHDEAFHEWRHAIGKGDLQAPFAVTHVDAHADIGLGDAGYVALLTEVMHLSIEERPAAIAAGEALGLGNWLAFAAACGWISEVDYVYGEGGGSDLLSLVMNSEMTALEFKPTSYDAIHALYRRSGVMHVPGTAELQVPFREHRAQDFASNQHHDAILLCRSPGFTTASADAVFDRLRSDFLLA